MSEHFPDYLYFACDSCGREITRDDLFWRLHWDCPRCGFALTQGLEFKGAWTDDHPWPSNDATRFVDAAHDPEVIGWRQAAKQRGICKR